MSRIVAVSCSVSVLWMAACSGDDSSSGPEPTGGCPAEATTACLARQMACEPAGETTRCRACASGMRPSADGACVAIAGTPWRHAFADFTTMPGEEVFGQCQSWTLGNEEELLVATVELEQDALSHHSNWTFVAEDRFPGPDGVWPCAERGYDQVQGFLSGGVLYAQSTQATHEVQQFPAGAVLRIPPRSTIIGDVHLLNVGTEPVTGNVELTLYAVAPEQAGTRLGPLHLVLDGLQIPPRSHTRNFAQCDLANGRPARSFSLYYLLPHTHSLATRFFVQVVGGERDGEYLMDLDGYDGESHGRLYDPPVDLSGITGLRFGCEWDNPRTESIRYGLGDQEMCELLAFVDSIAVEGHVPSVEEIEADGETRVLTGECESIVVPWEG